MKCIMAIIRIDKMNQTKNALKDAGFTSMTASGKVFGRGKGLWEAKVLEGVKQDTPEALEHLGKEPRLRPQRVLQIVVPDKRVSTCVETIIEANQTPAAGDGKIFVLPMNEAIRVRTGEVGDLVLDI
ncbi:P-II family nitrogen regulator [Carboxylicivirga sp. A043]|uniref:P-II family nitrogen regulator n=1 Tax=Carboxylicivirga litoralis TaxID=2816963 RepID=UPI0021CB7C45|nr:P-II family nitrogen regulator [Carboxylicivirga sp. A043]MCU4157130.1 P-II family nitrogen regulator [Carboxylicivirga sp. A043]